MLENKVQNVIVNFRGGLGDLIMLTPLFRTIKSTGSYQVILITTTQMRELVERIEHVDQVIYYDARMPNEVLASLPTFFKFVKQVRSYPAVCLLNTICTYGKVPKLISRVTRAGHKIGYNHGPKTCICDRVLSVDTTKHDIQLNLDLWNAFTGRESEDKQLNLGVRDDELKWASEFIESKQVENAEIIAMAPCVRWTLGSGTRQWPLNKFVELAECILGQTDQAVYLCCSHEEWKRLEELDEIQRLMKFSKFIYSDQPQTFFQSAAVLKQCKVLICNDSGLMHLAIAVDVPVLSFWGPTKIVRKGYGHVPTFIGVEAKGCKCRMDYVNAQENCESGECWESVSVKDVEKILEQSVI